MSSFTNTEECFNIKINKRSNTIIEFCIMFIVRFILDQKNLEYILLHIIKNFRYSTVSL